MLTLSEAMRLGAMAIPPVHGPIFERTDDGRCVTGICGACAIGTILYAVEGFAGVQRMDAARSLSGTEFIQHFVEERWPWSVAWRQERDEPLTGRIIRLFENDRWTREQIADWVETQERDSERQQALTDSPDAVRVRSCRSENHELSTRA